MRMRRAVPRALWLLLLSAAAAPAVAQTWVRAHGIGGYANAASVAATSDGGFVVAGDTEAGSFVYRQFSVVKLYPSGNVEWRSDFGTDRWDLARSVREAPDGGILVFGETGYLQGHFAGGLRDFWLVKLAADGTFLWQRAYGGSNHEYAQDFLVLEDGGTVLVGETHSFGATCSDVWVLRLDPQGDPLWQFRYGAALCERGYAVERGHGGGFVVAGMVSDTAAQNQDAIVLRLDDAGTLQWAKRYGPSGALANEWARSVSATPDGGYVVGATTTSFGGVAADWLILKLDGAGSVTWARRLDGARGPNSPNDLLGAVRPTPDGGYVAVGARPSNALAADDQLWVQKLDASGNFVWGRLYRGDDDDVGNDVRVLDDGGFVVAGSTGSFDVGSFWVLRLDPDGLVGDGCAPVAISLVLPVSATVPVAVESYATVATDAVAETKTLAEGAGASGVATQCVGPPTEVSPPGAAEPLAFSDPDTLVWQGAVASNADTFNLYRGDLGSLAGGDYGTCFASGLLAPTATDPTTPALGKGFTYVVSGKNAAGEGILGRGPSGTPRPNVAPCP